MTRVYFDNAATTPVAPEVVDAMVPVLRDVYGNPSSIHAEGRTARARVEQARKTVAHAIGASTGEIFFTSGGTESNNTAIKCAVRDLGVRRIISSPTEHHCGLHSIETVQRTDGVRVDWLPVDSRGRIDLHHLEAALAAGQGPTLVSLMHANNEIGVMIDLGCVSDLCRQYGALLHTDTVQTIGHWPIDVQQTPVTFLSGSAHKFYGPKGVGFLYIQSGVGIRPFMDGGAQERNMRGGTENVAGIVGLATALELAIDHLDARRTYVTGLRDYLMERLLATFDGLEFNGDPAGALSLPKVLSVSFPPSPKNEMLLFNLDIAGISASGGSACASGTEKGSHVLEAIGADPARRSVRFSFSHYNTREEADFVVAQLRAVLPGIVRAG